jgi:hypothetical protein
VLEEGFFRVIADKIVEYMTCSDIAPVVPRRFVLPVEADFVACLGRMRGVDLNVRYRLVYRRFSMLMGSYQSFCRRYYLFYMQAS